MDTAIVVVTAIVMAIGLAGTVLPILPGLWLMWAAALGYGLLTEFGTAGLVAFGVITVIATAGTVAGVVVPQRGAASIGVPVWGQFVAAGTSVAGMFLIPVVGAPIGFVVGILLVHILGTRTLRGAPAATWATIKVMLLTSGIQFGAGVAMVLVWVGWVLVG